MCKGSQVSDHITGDSKPKGNDDEEWDCVDAPIKSWFFSTCDPSLLQIISSDHCTAKDLWENLEKFFLNNKMSCMLELQDQFRNTRKGSSSITEFCHTLKNLVNDLKDVDSSITEVELVMQILRQLPPSYHNIMDVITNTKPFLTFLEAKNMLLLHESREANSDSTTEAPFTTSAALYSSSTNSGKSKNKWSKYRKNNKNASKGGGNQGNLAAPNSFAGILGNAQAYYANMATQQLGNQASGSFITGSQQQHMPLSSPTQQPINFHVGLPAALRQPTASWSSLFPRH
ncbi:uncharacterized protein LOC111910675 [Lactuca sativa]|uniref:uncharacterized protein LOC111910675 n=1 Tax=Lactuca sativa TaxID=4236 RepID=UPI000CD84963|nr:uncharacterized protein LOC111910675 [Lactuca sativa]